MYSDIGWCQNLFYRQGNYIKQRSDSHGCDFGRDHVKPFHRQSQQDFDAIKAFIKPRRVSRITDDSGFGFGNHHDGKQVVFHIKNFSSNRLYYVHTLNHGVAQTDGITDEILMTPINSPWFRINEDYN